MKSIRIDFLANHPQHIETLARWQQNEWHEINPSSDVNSRIAFMQNHPAKAAIPTTLAAINDNDILGSASLVENDMEDYTTVGPWLASLYVSDNHRCQGIASRLIEGIINLARDLNIETLYLFTPSERDFYAKRGWNDLERVQYHGETVDIMSYKLK